MDALSHRSLADACKLAGVTVRRYAHNDCASLRKELASGPQSGRTLIVADGVFSMEGDICILPELIAIKKEFGCYLLVDESHALGVIGPGGRGTDEHFGVSADGVDMWTGSLAKGIPSNGGFIAASQELSIYLQHAAAPFIFSGALCPAAVGAIRASLAILRSEPERVERLRSNARFLREGLRDLGYDTGMSETAIDSGDARGRRHHRALCREDAGTGHRGHAGYVPRRGSGYCAAALVRDRGALHRGSGIRAGRFSPTARHRWPRVAR